MSKKKNKKPKTTKKQIVKSKPKRQWPLEFKDSFSLKSFYYVAAIFTLLGFGLYFQSIPYEFVLDDRLVILDNNFTKSGFSGVWDILSTDSFQGYFGEQKDLVQGARYRPLSIVSFAIEYQFFGLNPKVNHFVNILLYILVCLMIYRVLHFMFPVIEDKWYLSFAFFISAIFLVHPLHVEAVANIKGRDEIMAMIGSIGALIYAFKYQDNAKLKYLAFAGLLYLFGLFSKETSLTFLAVIPISLYLRKKQICGANIKSFALIFGLAIFYLIVRYQVIGFLYDSGKVYNDLMNNPFLEMNMSEKYATIMYTFGQYIKLCLFPHPLTHDYYPYHIPIMQWTKLGTLISLALFITFLGLSLRALIKKQWFGYGALYFILTISIVSNAFVNVGTFMNERFAFMPSLGILILLFNLISKYKSTHLNKIYLSLTAVLLLAYSYKTLDRLPAWKDTYSLNSAAIKVSINSARLNSFMSTAIYNRIREMSDRDEKLALLNEGIVYARKAIEIYPSYYNGHLMLAGVSAALYGIDGDLNSLLTDFTTVGSVRPDIGFLTEYCDYLNGRSGINENLLIDFYYDLGYNQLYLKKRNPNWAIHYLKKGLELSPNQPKLSRALTEVYSTISN